MDSHCFDAFTRSLAAGTSRRALLKGVAGGLAAGLIGTLTREAAAAPQRQATPQQPCGTRGHTKTCASGGCCRPNEVCSSTTDLAGPICYPAGATVCGFGGTYCTGAMSCVGSECLVCSDAAFRCGGQCPDKCLDGGHCFRDADCQSGRCDPDGVCRPACFPGLTNCGGACVNTQTDPAHCGGCDQACPTTQPYCVVGGCQECRTNADCPLYQPVCLSSGTCGCVSDADCTAGEVCAGGVCEPCPIGRTPCGGECVELDTDPANCGACDRACSACETCEGGQCTPVDCGDPCLVCDPAGGQCVPVECPTGQVCVEGACQGSACTCDPDLCLVCGDDGGCVSACADGETCDGQGTCVAACVDHCRDAATGAIDWCLACRDGACVNWCPEVGYQCLHCGPPNEITWDCFPMEFQCCGDQACYCRSGVCGGDDCTCSSPTPA